MAKTNVDDVLGTSETKDKEDKVEKAEKAKPSASTSTKKDEDTQSEDKKSSETAKDEKKDTKTKETKATKATEVKDEKSASESSSKDTKEAQKSSETEEKVEKPNASDSKQPESTNIKVGTRIRLSRPTPIYRGPGDTFRGKPFGGTVEVIGETDKNGFTPVSFVRSGYGVVSGYIRLPKGAETSCQS